MLYIYIMVECLSIYLSIYLYISIYIRVAVELERLCHMARLEVLALRHQERADGHIHLP